VLINTHWLAQTVVDYIQANTPRGLQVKLFHEPQLLGSAGTLLANCDFFNEGAFFIIYGDNLSDVDLAQMRKVHQQYQPLLTLGTFATDSPHKCGIAEIDAEGVVHGFVEKPANPQSNCAAAGIYIAEPAIFEYFPDAEDQRPLDIGFDIIPRLVGQMRNYPINLLIDIGTHKNLQRARQQQTPIT
jgi:mannose-1-phosphate guanylyltransferase